MRALDFSLARAVMDPERSGIVLHDLDGGAAAKAAHSGTVRQCDRDGTRDLWGGSGGAAFLRRERAPVDAEAIGHAGCGAAESERLEPGATESGVAAASGANSQTGTGSALPGESAEVRLREAEWIPTGLANVSTTGGPLRNSGPDTSIFFCPHLFLLFEFMF